MAKQFTQIEPAHAAFIAQQHIFFTASAAATGRVNVSPRGADALRVLNPNTVTYLDQTGSGNETAAHLRASGRLTIMFCGFENVPMILRLYGQGRSLWRGTAEYATLLEMAYGNEEPPGARQIIRLDIDMVQTSCGYGVPLFDYKEGRPTLRRWAETKGEDGIAAYWREKNVRSIDGFETGVAADDPMDHRGLRPGGDEDDEAIPSPIDASIAAKNSGTASPRLGAGSDCRDVDRLATATG
jgi:hypothetical protein